MKKFLLAALPAVLIAGCGTPEEREIPLTAENNVIPEGAPDDVRYRNDMPANAIENLAQNEANTLEAGNGMMADPAATNMQ